MMLMILVKITILKENVSGVNLKIKINHCSKLFEVNSAGFKPANVCSYIIMTPW